MFPTLYSSNERQVALDNVCQMHEWKITLEIDIKENMLIAGAYQKLLHVLPYKQSYNFRGLEI